jgi:hypothetical protein
MRSSIIDSQRVLRSAKLYRSTNYSGGAGSNKVVLDSIAYDLTGALDIYNRSWHCSLSGYYQVNVSIGLPASGPTCQPMIYKNGLWVAGSATFTPNVAGAGGLASDIIPCVPGDYLEFWAWLSPAGTINGGPASTYMSIGLLEPRRQ